MPTATWNIPSFQKTPVATQVVSEGDGPTLVINSDLNNTVFIGDSDGIRGSDTTDVAPLAPNGSVTVDGKSDLFVVNPNTSPVTVYTVAGGMSTFLGLTGGGGKLAIPAIQSPNFINGVSGWQIAKDGSAQFNNLTIRGNQVFSDGWISTGDGTFTNTPGLFLYSGTPAAGNLIYTVTASNGTDKFGNNYLGGGEASYDNINFEVVLNGGAIIQWYNMNSPNPGATFAAAGSFFNASFGSPSIISISDSIDIQCTSGNAVMGASGQSGGSLALSISNNGNPQWQQSGPFPDGNTYYGGQSMHEVGGIVINSAAGAFTLIDAFSLGQGQRYELMVRMGYQGAQNAGAPVVSFSHGGSIAGGLSGVTAHGYTQFGWAQNAIYNGVGLSDRTGPTLQNGGSQYYETYATFVAPSSGTVGISGSVSITGDNWTVTFCHTRLRPIS